MQRLKTLFSHLFNSILNSYTLIFFSKNRVFGFILILVSFFDIYAGLSGVIAVVASNLAATLIGFNKQNIRAGLYGFNSLLTGLGIGLFYEPNPEFYLVLLFASLLTLMITIAMEGIIGKYGLPYLSIPFLAGIWMVLLASRGFHALEISERGIYSLNEMYSLGGVHMVRLYEWFGNINLHQSLVIYFRSLGAILFQYHLFPGLLVAIGLLIYSRTAFLLSLLGFYSAYLYYGLIGANFNELSYGYIGFNFILTAIAIGGFFIISSPYSFLWVILLTPLISFIISSTSVLLGVYQLSIYSLPFNLVVLLLLYIFKFRERSLLKPEIVVYQQFSPERNLYTQLNNKSRFANSQYLPLSLPFFGEWSVSQGHNGAFTHKNDWRHAWDFEIQDENGQAFKDEGSKTEDYYCYNKPVLAPADGWITEALGHIEDNEPGDMNMDQNWGNTIIIKHGEGLYTKLSHLKQGSIKVDPGSFVKKGDILAACGNSGRLPRPHIHFQVQLTPHIGSKTFDFPLGNYMLHTGNSTELVSYSRPREGDIVSNIQKNNTLSKTFHFIPGQKLAFEIIQPEPLKGKIINWEVKSDSFNYTYLQCLATGSKAFFRITDNIFYFTHFEGSKHSLLFAFYLSSYKVLMGFYKGLEIKDSFPPDDLNHKALLFVQDLAAPFYLFIKSRFSLNYIHMEDDLGDSTIKLNSTAAVHIGKFLTKSISFEFVVNDGRISRFMVKQAGGLIEVAEIPVK